MALKDAADQRVQLMLQRLNANQRVLAFVPSGEFEATAARQAASFMKAVDMLQFLTDDQGADLCERVSQMPWPENQRQRLNTRSQMTNDNRQD